MKKPDLEKRPGFFIARVPHDDLRSRGPQRAACGARSAKPAEAGTNRQVT
jgi:hypothetical protein